MRLVFSSLLFIFGFLPVVLLSFFLLARLGRRPAAGWLIGASLVFYGWWNPAAIVLLLGSIAVNYLVARLILASEDYPRRQAWITAAGVSFNLTALFYYKYLFSVLGFLHGQIAAIPLVDFITLPLGISFFSFTQIGYLIDCRNGVTRDRNLLNYVLFVTFFPHLIAGPILHNRDIMPQFADPLTYRLSAENLGVGFTIFVIGLLKKVVCADPLSQWVSSGYAHTAGIEGLAAWNVALSYSLQLYFDFSGYSDMAIGLARMLNVRFPRNFESPYKSQNLIEYWQRWHISLTSFLTMYLYTPIALSIMRWRTSRRLGINRVAQQTIAGFGSMIVIPLMITMILAGIWHGSGVTFLIFGLLHGFFLCVCHFWRVFHPGRRSGARAAVVARCAVTYLCVVTASIFFRAPSVAAALDVLAGMAGLHGVQPSGSLLQSHYHALHMVALYGLVWLCPNTQQIMHRYDPVLGAVDTGQTFRFGWSPNLASALALGLAAAVGVLALGGTTEFLYFQF